jgi:hypothetical protein
MKALEVDCPCCKAKLILDPQTGEIIQAKEHKEKPQSLQEFLKSESTRNQDLADKFAQAKQKEEAKKDLLNKKFEWAKKNQDKLPEAPKPDIYWD